MKLKMIEFVTPGSVLLQGLWFGGEKAKRAIIFVHGLSSNAFSGGNNLVSPLASDSLAVITFNNRGHDKVSRLRKIDKRKKKGYTSLLGGAAFEKFTDCVDDIQGAVDFVRNQGIKEIYLAGHSTGCQKSIYYLSRVGKQKQIKGVILMAPMSDYAAALKFDIEGQLEKIVGVSEKMVKEGRGNELLPLEIMPSLESAQRFLSLNTPDSKEEIFTYCQQNKKPSTFQLVKIPMIVVFAEKDEYRDRPTSMIATWFQKHSKSSDIQIEIISDAPHNFSESEQVVQKRLLQWLKNG